LRFQPSNHLSPLASLQKFLLPQLFQKRPALFRLLPQHLQWQSSRLPSLAKRQRFL
jgi:hypothetical protein